MDLGSKKIFSYYRDFPFHISGFVCRRIYLKKIDAYILTSQIEPHWFSPPICNAQMKGRKKHIQKHSRQAKRMHWHIHTRIHRLKVTESQLTFPVMSIMIAGGRGWFCLLYVRQPFAAGKKDGGKIFRVSLSLSLLSLYLSLSLSLSPFVEK